MASTGITNHPYFNWQSSDYRTYFVSFFNKCIHTTVTCSPARVSDWISDIKRFYPGRRLIVGLDIEWRPNTYRGQNNPVALLQLCIDGDYGNRCLIYQIFHSTPPEPPQSLASFLSDHSNTYVGKGIRDDLVKLADDYGIGGDAFYVDLGYLAADVLYEDDSMKNVGLKRLAKDVLGKEMEKPPDVTRSRWDNRWLTADQVQYACIDAFVSCEIGRALLPYMYQ